jgi:hypothetical protein
VEIPNNKFEMTNKFQHAAQAPALRVTEIQNPKQKTTALSTAGGDTALEFET